MQKTSFFWKVFACLTLAAFCFFGYSIVTAVDQLRFNLEEVLATLHELQDHAGIQVAANPETAPETGKSAVFPAATGNGQVANVEFYDPKAVSGGRIIQVSGADSGNMNCLINNDASVAEFWSCANDSLADSQFDNQDVFRPMLAESWSVSPDNLTYHIKLRKGVLWHNFTDPVTHKEWKSVPVTAHDFKFYLDVVKNEKVDCAPLRGYFADIDRIDVINDYEFDVVWKTPYFKSQEVTLGLQPLPRHLYAPDGKFDGAKFNDDHERNRLIVGCGPYQFDRWEKGKRVLFKRFEDYYGKKLGIMPPVKQLSFDIIKHQNTRLQALIAQDIDMDNLTAEQWLNNTSGPAFDGKTGWLRKIKYPAFAYSYIGLNLKNPLFQDKRVRVALSHLVNRDRIIRDAYSGLARAVSGPFFPDSTASDPSIRPYPFSVEKAKELLTEAGWRDTDGDGILDKDGKPFKFTIMTPSVNTTASQKIIPILKEDMAKAGIQMESLTLEWSVVLERIEKRSFDSCMIGWTASPSRPDPFQLWHSSHADDPASSNYISFKNPEADKLIEKIRTTFDEAERQKCYHAFHKLIHEEAPYLFLFSSYHLLAINRRYENVRVFPTGIHERILWVPAKKQLKVPGM